MQPVRQGVVHKQRHRQCRPPVDGHIFAPADAGIAVVRALRRVLQLRVVYPRHAGDKEEAPHVAVLGERAPLQHLFLAALPLGHELLIGKIALHRGVDIHAVRLHHGVGRRTPVVLRHPSIRQDAPPQLGHGVGRPHHRIQHAQEKRSAATRGHHVGDVHLYRQPGKGERHPPEVGKLPAAWVFFHVDDRIVHLPPPATKNAPVCHSKQGRKSLPRYHPDLAASRPLSAL